MDNLTCTHLNCQNVSNKNIQYKELIYDLGDNNITGLSKTWLDENDSDLNWNFDKIKYDIFRCDRIKIATGKTKGCVLLLVPKKYKPKVKPELNKLSDDNFESIWVEIQINKTKKKCL